MTAVIEFGLEIWVSLAFLCLVLLPLCLMGLWRDWREPDRTVNAFQAGMRSSAVGRMTVPSLMLLVTAALMVAIGALLDSRSTLFAVLAIVLCVCLATSILLMITTYVSAWPRRLVPPPARRPLDRTNEGSVS